MKQFQYQLSIEEVAYAMGVLGGSEVASGFLLALLGERPRREIEGRLLAASHSLVARGYLDFDLTDGIKGLNDELAAVVSVMIQNDGSIRCSRAAKGQEQVLSYYVAGQHIVEHSLRNQVVSHMELIPDAQAVVDRCGAFFGLPRDTAAKNSTQALGAIPAVLIEQIRENISNLSQEEIASQLTTGGLPLSAAQDLAEDLLRQDYRGSAIKIEVQDDQAVSDHGFLILKSQARFWILEIVPQDPPVLKVFRGTQCQFSHSLRMLLS